METRCGMKILSQSQPATVEKYGSAWGSACEHRQVENSKVTLIVFCFSSRFLFSSTQGLHLWLNGSAEGASCNETLKRRPLSGKLGQEAPLSFRVSHGGVGGTLATLLTAWMARGHQPGSLNPQRWRRLLIWVGGGECAQPHPSLSLKSRPDARSEASSYSQCRPCVRSPAVWLAAAQMMPQGLEECSASH